MDSIPKRLVDALATGAWRDPGTDAIQRILATVPTRDPLQLLDDQEQMKHVWRSVFEFFLDDPEFCLVRSADLRSGSYDPRLVIDSAVFVGGSTRPGDDVLIALDVGADPDDPPLLVFDWGRAKPNRWVQAGTLSILLDALTVEDG